MLSRVWMGQARAVKTGLVSVGGGGIPRSCGHLSGKPSHANCPRGRGGTVFPLGASLAV